MIVEPLDLYNNPFITRTCRPTQINSFRNIIDYPLNRFLLITIEWDAINRPCNIRPQLLQQWNIYAVHHNDSTCARSIRHVDVQFCEGSYGDDKFRKYWMIHIFQYFFFNNRWSWWSNFQVVRWSLGTSRYFLIFHEWLCISRLSKCFS